MTDYDAGAFDAYEVAGWEAIAGRFYECWSPITSQAIGALLDAVHVGQGSRILDVGTGAGDAAGYAVERGAEATGVDVAAAMVEIAARRNPQATFIQAAATELPFADCSFDAVVGNNVIQHIGEPGRAARELERVLTPGGRIALSSWDAPERSPFFAAVLGAVAKPGCRRRVRRPPVLRSSSSRTTQCSARCWRTPASRPSPSTPSRSRFLLPRRTS